MRLSVILALALLPALSAPDEDLPLAKLLPGSKPCPYPPQAQKEYVAGSVHFTARVRPDGAVEAVEVSTVPLPRLGFEESVRACVSEWRFEPAADGKALRRYEGRVRYRLDASEEAAIQALLEALAAAWNAGDMTAVDDLRFRSGDTPQPLPMEIPSLPEQLAAMKGWRMKLEPEFKRIRFLGPDAVNVGQPIRRQLVEGRTGQTIEPEALALDVVAAKGSRGWRLVRVSPATTTWPEGVRVGGEIREPRKTKDVKPHYPEIAKAARVQGVVVLECLITPEGKVTAVKVLRGIPLLDAAAIDAVRKWEYAPTLLDGKAVPVIMTVTVNFRLS